MANNWCKNVVLLFRSDIYGDGKEVLKIFSSLKSAKHYRRKHYGMEAIRQSIDLNALYPIERWGVTFASEV